MITTPTAHRAAEARVFLGRQEFEMDKQMAFEMGAAGAASSASQAATGAGGAAMLGAGAGVAGRWYKSGSP